ASSISVRPSYSLTFRFLCASSSAPLRGRESNGVNERLKDEVSIVRAIPAPAQGREGEGVGGVVGEVEATLEVQRRVLRIGDARRARAHEPVELELGRWLDLELADRDEVIERGCHLRYPRERRACRRGPWRGTDGGPCGGA